MISVQEFLIRARLEHHSLEAWISAGWLVPPQTEPELMFSDVDLARAQLIRKTFRVRPRRDDLNALSVCTLVIAGLQ